MNTFVRRNTKNYEEFETTEDLLNLDSVKEFKSIEKVFSHFAMSDNHLMLISNEGFTWWVAGYVEYPEEITLPKWEGGKFKAILPDGSKVDFINGEVVSSCGGVLTLKDGTKAKNLLY